MNDKREDRRVKKTKKALRESLSALMIEKSIRDISVQELTELADLNRATFYLHYKDIFDLAHQIEEEAIREVNEILDKYMPPSDKSEPYPLFIQLLQYIQGNANMCRMLLGEHSNQSFLGKLCVVVEEKCLFHWLHKFRANASEEDMLYFSSYMVHGYVAVIAKWVQAGMHTSPDSLAMLMNDMGLHSIAFLER